MSTIYLDGEHAEKVAKVVQRKYGSFLNLGDAKIKYLFFSTEKSDHLGKCDRTTGKWRYLVDFDYVVLIWKEWWDTAKKMERRALLFHELKHIQIRIVNDEARYGNRRHDCELFADEIVLFGPWRPCLRDALTAFQKVKSE